MKILILVEDLRINITSAGICNSNIISALLKFDHEINCLYDYSDCDVFPWLQSSSIVFSKIISFPKVIPLKLVTFLPKSDAISAYTSGFTMFQNQKIKNWEKAINQNLKNNTYDFILLLGAGNSMLNYFAMLTVKTKIPYIVNYHDPYPDHQYPKPYQGKNSSVSKIRARKSNKVIQKAFKVSFPSQRLFEWMLQYHQNLKGKQIILPHPNGELQNLTTLIDDNTINLNTNKFNIIHLGSLLGHRNPTYLIKAFIKFIDSNPEKKQLSVLNIIGSIAKNNGYLDLEKKLKSDNVNVIKQRISYHKSLSLLKEANVSLIIEAIAEDSPFMPGKLTDYIVANKPILALTPEKSEVSRLLGLDYKYRTEAHNADEIVAILNLLWDNWKNGVLQTLDRQDLKEYVSAFTCNQTLIQSIQ